MIKMNYLKYYIDINDYIFFKKLNRHEQQTTSSIDDGRKLTEYKRGISFSSCYMRE